MEASRLTPTQVSKFLAKTIPARLPILLTGSPGVGKTDLVIQAAIDAECDIVISHPVVSDPTDAKGLPWPDKDSMTARFLPLGEVAELLTCTRPTVWFLDDLGQAAPATQCSYMQWLLARRVNGHILPDHVTIIAATNRRQDRAGVQGILEPVKSRFASIIEVNTSLDGWCNWAIGSGIETTVLAFLRYRPELLCAPNPTADMSNAPSPRTWANLSKLAELGLPKDVRLPVYAGAVGHGAAVEYLAYEEIFNSLVTADEILINPGTATIPTKINELYAVATALAAKTTKGNCGRAIQYLERVCEAGKGEFAVLSWRDATRRTPTLSNTREAIGMYAERSDSKLGALINGKVAS